MVRNAANLLLGVFIVTTGIGQTKDPKAKSILDKVSQKTKSYTSIKAEFSYILENKSEGINESQSGNLIVKGDKYILNIAGQKIVSNGKTVWTYIEDADEVQINNVPDPAEDDAINPSTIFTIWESGFKYKFKEEIKQGDKTIQIILLYPIKASEKNYHTVKVYVDKALSRVTKMVVKGKEGNDYIYKIKKFTPNVSVTDASFSFDTSKVDEVIDLRD